METQEILFQRRVIIKEKEVIIPKIQIKTKIIRRCNERPSKVRVFTEEEVFIENLKRMNKTLNYEV